MVFKFNNVKNQFCLLFAIFDCFRWNFSFSLIYLLSLSHFVIFFATKSELLYEILKAAMHGNDDDGDEFVF